MNIDNIRDADDAFAYLEKLATDAKRVSAKLAEFSRQKTTYNPHGDRFLTPNGVATVAIDAAKIFTNPYLKAHKDSNK
jgi:hypothetical protein